MAFKIVFVRSAAAEIKALRTFDRRRVAEEIGRQLSDRPTTSSRNRKCLRNFTPDFEHAPPIWELRVGTFRVFYDVDEEDQVVNVRAVREKPPGQTTEDIA